MAPGLLGNLDCAKSIQIFILYHLVVLLMNTSQPSKIQICPKFYLQALFLSKNVRGNLPGEEPVAAKWILPLISKNRAWRKRTTESIGGWLTFSTWGKLV